MQLTEHRNEHRLFVRKADASAVTIVDREYRTSILLAADRLIDDFAPRHVDELDDAAVARILALRPDVVLLGTGARVVFPPPRILAAFLQRGIGCEALDNAAAARTFNVLAGEGRQAVAVFLIESCER